ncbi:MAG: hypothetical protein GQ570_02520 [Helicobacteraceae bacterium]|nr:hypothetical protein [Helicobacteraceae bacterium]
MSTQKLDKYEQELEDELPLLEKCQKEKGLTSCFNCEFFIGCEVRKKYVAAVYNSMSKGATGGFEF